MKKLVPLAVFVVLLAVAAGVVFRSRSPELGEVQADYSHGYYPKEFFDEAYEDVGDVARVSSQTGLVAHHLLVKDKIAEVFARLADDEVKTVVLVSPNHFSLGMSPAQVSQGNWSTPYGVVESDHEAIAALTAAMADLHVEETAAPHEHGIGVLMPFVARSFPEAKVVPIMLDESLSAEAAWLLGETIAETLPGAVLFASIDMTHYRDAAYTAVNDAAVLALLEEWQDCASERCDVAFDIDSNASLRTLLGFVRTRGAGAWQLTHHGSSLEMGATTDPAENTSHILGYFLQ